MFGKYPHTINMANLWIAKVAGAVKNLKIKLKLLLQQK